MISSRKEIKQEYLKRQGNKRKKAKRDNLDDYQIKQLRKCEKNIKKVMRVNLDDAKENT